MDYNSEQLNLFPNKTLKDTVNSCSAPGEAISKATTIREDSITVRPLICLRQIITYTSVTVRG